MYRHDAMFVLRHVGERHVSSLPGQFGIFHVPLPNLLYELNFEVSFGSHDYPARTLPLGSPRIGRCEVNERNGDFSPINPALQRVNLVHFFILIAFRDVQPYGVGSFC